jgi:3-hydroxy-D-aspartate aldolase
MAAGAVGICCAKLGEAEALSEGVLKIFSSSPPVVTPQAIARLIALNKIAELMVVMDHPANGAPFCHHSEQNCELGQDAFPVR